MLLRSKVYVQNVPERPEVLYISILHYMYNSSKVSK